MRSTLAAFLALAIGATAASAIQINPPPGPPPNGPYVISQTYTPPPAPGPITTYKIAGRINLVKDPAGYFSAMPLFMTFSGTLSVDPAFFVSTPTWDTQSYACNPGATSATNICDCACNFPVGSPFRSFSSPGTDSCLATSYAKTAGSSCIDNSTLPYGPTDHSEWIAQPAGANGFSLKFADGSTLAQDPTQAMIYFTAGGAHILEGGQSLYSDPFVTMPKGPLLCTSPSGFCTGASEVEFGFNNVGFDALATITINYVLPGNLTGFPDGYIQLAIMDQWVPGLPDLGGPMIWQNTWKPNTAYKTNDVVSFNGVTYLASNMNYNMQPDTDPLEWRAIGSSGGAGGVGPQGPAGPQGPQGPPGANGQAGAPGAIGPQGPIGLTGAIGPQGPIGLTGAIGPQGPTGLSGAIGPQGPIGLTGPIGPQGPIGPVGPQGPTGLLDTATLTQIQNDLSSLKGQSSQQQSDIAALKSRVATLTADLRVAAVAGFAALEVNAVAENFVAVMEAQGTDPVTAVEQVAADLGISINPDSVSSVSMSETEYNHLVHQLQAKLAVATVALANAQAANNTFGIDRWLAAIAKLNGQLASVKAGNF